MVRNDFVRRGNLPEAEQPHQICHKAKPKCPNNTPAIWEKITAILEFLRKIAVGMMAQSLQYLRSVLLVAGAGELPQLAGRALGVSEARLDFAARNG
jgi:hypothetical protein